MKVCLVGATHPCHNPRLVREADTLIAAGHSVRVVAPSFSERLAAKDRRLVSVRTWDFEPVDFRPTVTRGRVLSAVIRGRRRAAQVWHHVRPTAGVADLAYSLAFTELKRAASR